jgi:hypothetical protein
MIEGKIDDAPICQMVTLILYATVEAKEILRIGSGVMTLYAYIEIARAVFHSRGKT